ncbi:MAG TPA: sigma 54-interacting transcriptional regulator [Pyrinomonadaceae bacterium]
MKVLYVEDNLRDADVTVRMLRKAAPSIEVELAPSIVCAMTRLSRLVAAPLDLVLTDMDLRDGDGLSLLKHIRENAIPVAVVVVTGMGDEETAVAALKGRADDYVAKHKDYLDRLPDILENALQHYRADAARRARPLNVLYAKHELSQDIDEVRNYLALHAPHIYLNVSTPVEALYLLQHPSSRHTYDVLLLDFEFPEIKALEFIREWGTIAEQDLPVVVVCSPDTEGLASQWLKRGVASYLVKVPGYFHKLRWELEDAHSRAELQRGEIALRASEARNRAILSAIPDLMFLQKHDGTYLDYHAKDPDALLMPPQQFLGKKMQDVLPPELAMGLAECFERALVSDKPVILEYSLEVPQGPRFFEASVVKCDDERILSTVRDITERKEAEKALRQSEEHLRQAQQAAKIGTWEWDVETGEAVWSDMIWQLLGLEPGEGPSTHEYFLQFVHPDDLESFLRKSNEAMAGAEYYNEFRIVRKDGQVIWVSSKGRAVCSEDNVRKGMIGVTIDITQRKQADEALRQSEEHLRQAQQAARVGTWEWDVKTGNSVWSEMIWQLLGLEPGAGESTLERFVEFIHPDDRAGALAKATAVIDNGTEYYDEFRIIPRNGQVIWVASKGRVIRSADGRPERMIGVNIDITERKIAEESLKNALAEVQQLKDRLHEENIYLKEEIRVAANFGQIVGESEALRRVLSSAERVAPLNTTVLILGETGTGKELLAHAIHNLSPRSKHPLVKVNCAALPAPLIESELFGHEKGAFTGADTKRAGRFAVAHGGTIFLDEVGELPLDLQAKLLRVLEEGELEVVGSSRTVHVDVRVIAATNRNLADAVVKGTFRSDLYYRLSIFPITMPPLRERREDIPMLVTHLVKQLSRKLGKEIETIPHNAMTMLQNYPWPGNVRELRNVIERAVIISEGSNLRLGDSLDSLLLEPQLPEDRSKPERDQNGDNETLEQNEYNLILRTLKKVYWRIEGPGGAAEILNVHPSTLRSRMRKLGIDRPRFKATSN